LVNSDNLANETFHWPNYHNTNSFKMKSITIKANKDKGLLVFRVIAAFAIIKAHGLPKLLHFQETLQHIPDPLGMGTTFSAYIAVFTNVFCALLVALGLFTRMAAFFIFSLTITGLLLVHFNDSSKIQDVPLIYSIVFGYIAYIGSGKYSLDYKIIGNRNEN
jgi:putative oxidoreductase